MFKLFSKLSEFPAVSGREDSLRDFVISEIKDFCEYKTDPLGNLICHKKGKKTAAKKIMLDAHLDEVGVIARGFTEDGFVKFSTVGGISPAVLSGRRVIFEKGVLGVVCSKPVHLSNGDEKKKYTDEEKLVIDIGATSRDEAVAAVSLGDTAVFCSEYTDCGDTVMARAIDDRAGVALLISLLKEEAEYDFYAVFSTQEEVGCRGAKVAAFGVAPDGAIVLEATTAADLHGVSEESRVCKVGDGPAVSFMDRGALYDRRLFDAALGSGLKHQVKAAVAGGNNSGAIHLSREGVPTIAISVPCRYIHAPSSLCSKQDVAGALELAKYMLLKMASGEIL